LKIFVAGTRGIPNIPGGVEKHCQELYPLIAQNKNEVYLATRTPYVSEFLDTWQSVRLKHVFAPRKKSIEAIVHTFLSVICAKFTRADILHIHAIGPGLMVPFARLLGLKVVLTNHGPDYEREKWGPVARVMLKIGEYLGCKFSNETIAISQIISDIINKRCDRRSIIINNGVPLPEKSKSAEFVESIGLGVGNYILTVSRFVPEKGLGLLVKAFQGCKSDFQLVIAGDADHETEYSRKLKRLIDASPNVIRTGYITGEALNQIFSHSGLFVLPSYHEGLPIALLEALSYGLPVLVSNIPANLEVGLPEERYFKSGDIADLREKMNYLIAKGMTDIEKEKLRYRIKNDYNWTQIDKQTIAVYKKVVTPQTSNSHHPLSHC